MILIDAERLSASRPDRPLFTDVSLLTSWVPGLREAQVITGTRALPTEIHFEFAGAQSET